MDDAVNAKTALEGRPRFPLWYFDRPPHDLRQLFPENGDVHYVQRILKKCVVEREDECLPDATALLAEVDDAINALEVGGQLPSEKRQMRCQFCGIGRYQQSGNVSVSNMFMGADKPRFFICNQCGHTELFLMQRGGVPEAWE